MYSVDSRESDIDECSVEMRHDGHAAHLVLQLDTANEEEFVGEGLMPSAACSVASVCNSLNMSQVNTEDLVDSIFHNCNTDQTGWVPVSRLLNYITCIIEAEGHSIGNDLEDLWLMFHPNGVDISVDLQTYRDVMDRWVDQLRHSSEFQMTSECENLIEYSSKISPLGDNKFETFEKSIPSSAESSPKSSINTPNFINYYMTESSDECEKDYSTFDRSELMTEISELKFKNLKIKEELLKLRGFAAHVEDQNVNLISENDELKKKLEIFQINSERHRSLERESLELHDGLARCVAECLISKDKIRELKKENSSFQLQIKDLKKELCSAYTEVDSLKLSEDRLIKSASKLKSELEDSKAFLKSREELWKEDSLKIEELQNVLNDQEHFSENLKEEKCQQEKKILKLLDENANLQQELCLLRQMKNKITGFGLMMDNVDCFLIPNNPLETDIYNNSSSWKITSLHAEIRNMVNGNDTIREINALSKALKATSYNAEKQWECINVYPICDEECDEACSLDATPDDHPVTRSEFDTVFIILSTLNKICWRALHTVHHLPLQRSPSLSSAPHGKATGEAVNEKPHETDFVTSPQHVAQADHDAKLADLWSVLGMESDIDSNPDCQEATVIVTTMREKVRRELAALCLQLTQMQAALGAFAKGRPNLTTVGTSRCQLPLAKQKKNLLSQSSCYDENIYSGMLPFETVDSSSPEHSQKSPSESSIVKKQYSRFPIGKLSQTNTKSLDHGSSSTPPSVHKRCPLSLSCPNLPSQINLVTKSTQTEVCWNKLCEIEDSWHYFVNNCNNLTPKDVHEQMPPCPELVHYPQKRQRSYSFLAAINDENVPIREISNETVEHRPVVISEVLDNLKMPRESPSQPPYHDGEKMQPGIKFGMPGTTHTKIDSKSQNRAIEGTGEEKSTNANLVIGEHTEKYLSKFSGVKSCNPQIKRSCAIELDEPDLQVKPLSFLLPETPNLNHSVWDSKTVVLQPGCVSRCSMAEISETESAKDSLDSEPEQLRGMSSLTTADCERDFFNNLNDDIFSTVSTGVHNKLKLHRLTSGGIEQLSDEEVANEFHRLALAFRTDSFTRHKRLQLHQRQRELAESNVEKELNVIKDFLQDLQINRDGTFNSNMQLHLSRLQHHIEIVHQATVRVSARSEVYGAIQQEDRVCQSVALMIRHVENVKKQCEKLQKELEQARQLLQDSIIHDISSPQASATSSPKSILLNSCPALRRRRASVAVDLQYSHHSVAGYDICDQIADNKSDGHIQCLAHNGSKTSSNLPSPDLPPKLSCSESVRSFMDGKGPRISEGSKKENGRQRQLSSELVQEEPGLCNDEGGLFADCRQRSCVRQDSETAERCVNVSRQQLHVQEFRTGPLLCDNIEKFDQKDVKRAQCKGLLKCVQFHKRQLLNAFKVGRIQSKRLITMMHGHMTCLGQESDMSICIRYVLGGLLLLAAAFSLISSFLPSGHLPPPAAGACSRANEWISWEEIIRPYLRLRHPFPPPF